MEAKQTCPECGATWHEGQTCQDYFYQMLYWENEYPGHGEVHHLTVLCYHLQHPSLYSPQGLREAMHLLTTFVEEGAAPQEVRKRNSARVNSSNRSWKIKGTPTSHGIYDPPVRWNMTAADVVAGGADHYRENVRAWARSAHETLKAAGIFPVSVQ